MSSSDFWSVQALVGGAPTLAEAMAATYVGGEM
jgi:hypothetical protein